MIRKINRKDIKYIYNLWEKHFPADIAKKREAAFETILFLNPFSNTKDGYYVLEQDNDIIGYLGVMPYRFSILNNAYDGAIFQDSMIHPKMRGKGVGTQVVRDVLSKTDCVSIAVWMNAPNSHVFEKCGWKPVAPVYSLIRGYKSDPIIRIENETLKSSVAAVLNVIISFVYRLEKLFYRKILSRYRIEEIDKFDDRMDVFFDSVRSQFPFICYRTKDALNWKFCKSYGPKFIKCVCIAQNQLVGYMVSSVTKRDDGMIVGTIYDFLVSPQNMDVFDALLKFTIQNLENRRPDLIEVLCTDQRFHLVFKKHGFFLKKSKEFALKYINEEKIEGALDFSDSRNWFYTYGDGDKVFMDF